MPPTGRVDVRPPEKQQHVQHLNAAWQRRFKSGSLVTATMSSSHSRHPSQTIPAVWVSTAAYSRRVRSSATVIGSRRGHLRRRSHNPCSSSPARSRRAATGAMKSNRTASGRSSPPGRSRSRAELKIGRAIAGGERTRVRINERRCPVRARLSRTIFTCQCDAATALARKRSDGPREDERPVVRRRRCSAPLECRKSLRLRLTRLR